MTASNTKDTGDLSEAMVLARFLQLKWTVLKPFGDNRRYDLVIDRGNGFERVQVKTAWVKGETLVFSTCSSYTHRGRGKKNYRGQADLFAVYSPDLDAVYMMAVDEVGVSNAKLRLKPSANNQTRNVRMAKDFELSYCKENSHGHPEL